MRGALEHAKWAMQLLLPFKLPNGMHGLQSVLAAIIFFFSFAVANSEINKVETPFDSTSSYHERKIEGWLVLVNTNLLADGSLCDRTLKLLGTQLYQITHVVPPEPLEKLRQIPIWVERLSEKFPCMCYHESREWLSAHNVNPEKTGAVELANATNFLASTRDQPWMVLHELAHGYHQRFLKGHSGIRRCFETARASRIYESVLRANGKRERHYALNNEKEYFAEMTEAFFGANDFYPFVRAELKEYDPEMFNVLREVWGEKSKEPARLAD